MGHDIANIKSTAAAEHPVAAGLEFVVTESGAWAPSTVTVMALPTATGLYDDEGGGGPAGEASELDTSAAVDPMSPEFDPMRHK